MGGGPVGSYAPKGGRSLLVGVLQDTVGDPRGAFGAMLLLHDRQCGRGVDLRNVVIVFQGPVGERSFEVRLDCRSFCMHVRHTCNDIHGPSHHAGRKAQLSALPPQTPPELRSRANAILIPQTL